MTMMTRRNMGKRAIVRANVCMRLPVLSVGVTAHSSAIAPHTNTHTRTQYILRTIHEPEAGIPFMYHTITLLLQIIL